MGSTVTVTAAHLEPVLLNKRDTVRKTIDAIGEAASNGVQFLAFPEGACGDVLALDMSCSDGLIAARRRNWPSSPPW
ncbi:MULTISPECIES: hypothetical protein [unclassified Streptomyces]|uniref:hypothetical protein n=1 Tax=unclassified Streptomyces TaxID=2593676 RepID=UPI002251E22C|nr:MULTISPECIES: hypothetical protein [unclassified Streptomyces]MCX4406923.1 hypothetical protein [Streptomyces sp. NBC_01764]MCX5188389.1 hypothetical protein [Streptomyces sp. NBC_00268]